MPPSEQGLVFFTPIAFSILSDYCQYCDECDFSLAKKFKLDQEAFGTLAVASEYFLVIRTKLQLLLFIYSLGTLLLGWTFYS